MSLAMVTEALLYAAHGWHVFPLRAGTKKPFGEKEWLAAGFKPANVLERGTLVPKFGCRVATRDAAQIQAWWKRWPDADIGLHCSRDSGVWVLDADIDKTDPDPAKHKDGFQTIADYAAAGLDLPVTVRQSTPSGGRHWFFRWPAGLGPDDLRNTQKRLGNGLDTRAEGGYVVLPPSRHPSGKARYRWDDGCAPHELALADAPFWLVDKLRPQQVSASAAPAQPRHAADPRAYDTGLHPYVRKILDDECARIRAAGAGQRHHTLFAAAAAVGSRIGQGGLTRAYAEQHLLVAGHAMAASSGKRDWTAQEVERVVKDALDRGERDIVPIPESAAPAPRREVAPPVRAQSAAAARPMPAAAKVEPGVADGPDGAVPLWAAAHPVEHEAAPPDVLAYLRRFTAVSPLPPTLRAATVPLRWRCCDGVVRDQGTHPCLLAAAASGRVAGLYRHFLAAGGKARAMIQNPDRRRDYLPSVLPLGAVAGREVRLGPVTEQLTLVASLELGLHLLDQAPGSVWACMSLADLARLELPSEVREVYFASWRAASSRPGASPLLERVQWRLSAGGRRLLRLVSVPVPPGVAP